MTIDTRIGIIGCGDHQRQVLLPQLATLDGARLVACADINEIAAHETQERFGFERPYLDYHEMLSREELNGVMVATPHYLLKEATIAAIESGVNVFVEKPMAINRQEAEEIRAAAQRNGVDVMVGYCQRFAEGRRIMKSLIENGAIGDITAVNAAKGTSPLSGWLTDPQKGGGVLLWLGVHITDQVLWMVDSEAKRVYSEVMRHSADGVDQNSVYTIRFENDVMANIICSQNVGSSFDYIEALGSAGRVRCEWPSNVVTVSSETFPEYRHPTDIRPRNPRAEVDKMYLDELQAWVSSVAERRAPPITVDDGVNVLEIISAVIESGKTGEPVVLK